MTYLLDSDSLIDAARIYYDFDIAPGFWTWLADVSQQGDIASVEAVRDELKDGFGDLGSWIRHTTPEAFWRRLDHRSVEAAKKISQWALEQDTFNLAAVDQFLDSCDYWLVAEAKAYRLTLVTKDVPSPFGGRAVTIPDVCEAVSISYEHPVSVYRKLGLRLDISPDTPPVGRLL